MKIGIPILGICRGEQILNVTEGGSLIIDIPSDYPDAIVHQTENQDSCFHPVKIVEDTFLHQLAKETVVEVNSNHHQAVDQLAQTLIPSAYSPDGIIEAFEWKDKSNKPFMLAVQWHPERLEFESPLSSPIASAFIKASKEYDMKHK